MDAQVLTTAPLIYPESDGKPVGETDVHRQEILDLIAALSEHFRPDPRVYVSGNLMLYYEQGNPSAVVSPDVFVVRGINSGQRRVYKLWVEGVPPTLVIEISSRSTRLDDLGSKRALYAMLGVTDYILFDPLAEYLTPPLQGFHLVGNDYVRLEPDTEGALVSMALGVRLRCEETRLALFDLTTGERLRRPAEEAAARRAEAAARQAAEERVADLEAELVRLRAELAQRQAEPEG